MNETAGKGKIVETGETVVNIDDDDIVKDTRLSEGYGEASRRRAGMGLEMTPAQRLKWLEEAVRTLGRWRGRARKGRAGEANTKC